MKNPFINHSFTKIGETLQKSVALSSAQGALEQLENVNTTISQSGGVEAGENVLSYRAVKHALERCIAHYGGSGGAMTDVDVEIYYAFAYTKLEQAEGIIDSELSELDL